MVGDGVALDRRSCLATWTCTGPTLLQCCTYACSVGGFMEKEEHGVGPKAEALDFGDALE